MSSGPQFTNPIAFDSISGLMTAILNVFIIISTPIVVFFLILAGFSYVTARGNPEKIKQAQRALLYGMIGGTIIVGAVAILVIIKSIISAF